MKGSSWWSAVAYRRNASVDEVFRCLRYFDMTCFDLAPSESPMRRQLAEEEIIHARHAE